MLKNYRISLFFYKFSVMVIMLKPLIKWPGGKTSEITKFEYLIPSFERYIEPFMGGGAVFFHLNPKQAVINDISASLIDFYQLIKEQNTDFHEYLLAYYNSFQEVSSFCERNYSTILQIYQDYTASDFKDISCIKMLISSLSIETDAFHKLILDKNKFQDSLIKMIADKFTRSFHNHSQKPFCEEDLKNNLITGFFSGYYMYFRDIYNSIRLNQISVSKPFEIANFYFIREYCYGSMFRYNRKGEFNIPYGGISYNKKNFLSKINSIFQAEIRQLFENTKLYQLDFEEFFHTINLTEQDFMFLDPPYDTDFSAYEGRSFNKIDQKRLADCLLYIPARFILVIKNTDYIFNLYKENFRILNFNNQYTYNVRSRNTRHVEHLIVTNIPE